MRIPYRHDLLVHIDTWSWKKYHIPFRFKYFYQRAVRGWSDADVWNFCDYLADVIGGGVVELAESGVGYPPQITEADGIEYDCDSRAEWCRLLGIIASGMEAHREADFIDCDDIKEVVRREEDLIAQRDHALQLVARNFGYLWD
ncbi:MAG: hypothetical protein WC322_06540 [Candidatus Paceibacterota bacterium]